MGNHIENRQLLIDDIKEELIGPCAHGTEIDCDKDILFNSYEELNKSYVQLNTKEEILQNDPPNVRYGIGVLFPIASDNIETEKEVSKEDILGISNIQDEELLSENANQNIESIGNRSIGMEEDTAYDDFAIFSSTKKRPSSMGISFLAEFNKESSIIVEVYGGRYSAKKVKSFINSREFVHEWWLRKSVSFKVKFNNSELIADGPKVLIGEIFESTNLENLKLEVSIFSRPYSKNIYKRLFTICLVNRCDSNHGDNNFCLFQSNFKVIIDSKENSILPYPSIANTNLDKEEESLALLYRNIETYAIGHGCSANWGDKDNKRKIKWVSAECLPYFESPSITPEILDEFGTPIEASMHKLSGLNQNDDGINSLKNIIESYDKWIIKKRQEINNLEDNFKAAAISHLNECNKCSERMKNGLDFLLNNEHALKAFKLANYAMLLQQYHTSIETRKVTFDEKALRLIFSPEYNEPDINEINLGRGKWRPFQIAFILMVLKSAVEDDIKDRETVELIWFPTGGGKTEAYLGLSAFVIFYLRLINNNDNGVKVLMRYTLRLLTTQQFQRASGLICAMEHIRRKNINILGIEEFSIGIWLGGKTTPNTRKDAIEKLKSLQNGKSDENPFVVSRCPWCGAQIGKLDFETSSKKSKYLPKVFGYELGANSVVFKCQDNKCEFKNGIPLYVIDEDIYEKRPSLIIGTVDKFAMLAWKPNARWLFGIDSNGDRQFSPPKLIIQDELHLISGPLGSMVGLYETIIEELCTDRRDGKRIIPKIICSTATIRRYKNQIKSLYSRDNSVLFPSPGLDSDDSFFARVACNKDGQKMPGRIYIGIHAPALKSIETVQVRTISSLLNSPIKFTNEYRDPWWTVLLFFNSLRELGITLSIIQSRIPDYLKFIRKRLNQEQLRYLNKILELTGRLRNDEVPRAIIELENSCNSTISKPVDICLASNIIEVGIDITRLSLLTVIGQPKSTSQYIQVTGRVGRNWWERPGLIVTIYNATRPRDRSHFEHFRSYHEKLYAGVEPTSVTPFSPPVIERALHAIMAIYARQMLDVNSSPNPCPIEHLEFLKKIILQRVNAIDPDEFSNVERVFNKRIKEWCAWQPIIWQRDAKDIENIPLLREPGNYSSKIHITHSWSTPMSMRNVDAECRAQITTLYMQEGEEDNAF